MDEKSFNEYTTGVAKICAVDFSKTSPLNEQEFDKLVRILEKELALAFKHLLV